MSVSPPFRGSGEFESVREWSCPNHDRPGWHECDCQFCAWEQPACCRAAKWVDVFDGEGNAVLRELGLEEVYMRNLFAPTLAPSPLLRLMESMNGPQAKIAWLEDEVLTNIKSKGQPA